MANWSWDATGLHRSMFQTAINPLILRDAPFDAQNGTNAQWFWRISAIFSPSPEKHPPDSASNESNNWSWIPTVVMIVIVVIVRLVSDFKTTVTTVIRCHTRIIPELLDASRLKPPQCETPQVTSWKWRPRRRDSLTKLPKFLCKSSEHIWRFWSFVALCCLMLPVVAFCLRLNPISIDAPGISWLEKFGLAWLLSPGSAIHTSTERATGLSLLAPNLVLQFIGCSYQICHVRIKQRLTAPHRLLSSSSEAPGPCPPQRLKMLCEAHLYLSL